MDQSKPWYASTGVWGAAIAAITPVVAAVLHVNVSADDTAQLVNLVSAGVEVISVGIHRGGELIFRSTPRTCRCFRGSFGVR
jgi:hypothetical protein